MNVLLKEKIKESFSSVLPITIIVLLLSIFIVPIPTETIIMFLAGAALLIVGMGFFTMGAEMSMSPMGEGIGVQLTKAKKIWIVLGSVFIMGLIITIAEPDLQVLAKQVSAIPDTVLIWTVAVGVGLLLTVAVMRILFHIPLLYMLIGLYMLVFVLSFFAPDNFIAVAFDSGGVTTGPITVPFILALGVGMASVRSDKKSQEDSFGMVALSSIGPMIAVLILGIVYNPQDAAYSAAEMPVINTTRDVALEFARELPEYLSEVLSALIPIIIFFIIFQMISKRYKKQQLLRMGVGFVYTLIGLVLFLTGVSVGFIPVGQLIGAGIAGSNAKWLLIPIGMVIGYFIVSAEPAVHVLNKQVDEVSGGAIPARTMMTYLAIGMAVSLGISMLRILTGISIYWFLIPGYSFALILSFFVPKIFTGIAFDSGGVTSGPMTSTFLLPFAIGACEAVGGNVLTDAFGIVAMVAMTPLITIQLMGLIYGKKLKRAMEAEEKELQEIGQDELLDYEEEANGYA